MSSSSGGGINPSLPFPTTFCTDHAAILALEYGGLRGSGILPTTVQEQFEKALIGWIY
jgi:hypothetical protein